MNIKFVSFGILFLFVCGSILSSAGCIEKTDTKHINDNYHVIPDPPDEYNIERTLSDGAQRQTIAFDALAFLTGNLGSQSFLPPGKVADFSGFQYLRDNTPSGFGHNTDFVTTIAFNVLHILSQDQISQLVERAKKQVDLINEYAYKRYPLMDAFRRLLEDDLPPGSNGLDKQTVVTYSSELYRIDGEISYDRAELLGGIVRSMTDEQKNELAFLQSLPSVEDWDRTLSDPLKDLHLDHDVNVAVMTYASEMYSWYTGSVEADTYFCPERQGTYFGSFYLKDWPAMGNPDYTIDEGLTARAGEDFLQSLTGYQKDTITGLVDIQKQDLYEIVDTRENISTELRRFINENSIDKNKVISLSETYGSLDGEIVYHYATHFASVGQSLDPRQKNKLQSLVEALGYIHPTGGFLYSHPIDMPKISNTDFFFEGYANKAPLTPDVPKGQTIGSIVKEYNYSFLATDPEHHQIYYLVDWGDSSNIEWFGPYDSEMEISVTHAWNVKGSYEIRVKARDVNGMESDWSEPLIISMPKTNLDPNQTMNLQDKYVIVDTGQNICYDESEEILYPQIGESFYGQDAQYFGNQQSYTLSTDGLTVYDEVTGLTWTQSPDWNNDGAIDSHDKFIFADFLGYPDTLNAENYGGYRDWRTPTIKELYSLIDFRGTDPSTDDTDGLIPFIDTNYFAFGYGDTAAGERIIDAQFWSSTEYVSTTMGGSATTFGVNFADGRIKGYGREDPMGREMDQYALFVRGNTDYGLNSFHNNGDSTVTDLATGLMWSQDDSGIGMNWEDALAWVQQINEEMYLGYSDWRLPNAKELQSIIDYSRSPDTTDSAAIDPIFSVTEITNLAGQKDYPFYWTSTTHIRGKEGNGGAAVYISFGRGLGSMDGMNVIDVHGAGCQRSDPKDGDSKDYPKVGMGPQGDVQRVFNYIRLVRNGLTDNQAPKKPEAPVGSNSGTAGTEYSYTTSTSDSDGDQVYYWFDWDDGSNTGWLGPYDSGEAISASHSWNSKGSYEIRVKAKDSNGAQSEWSDPLPVSMPKRNTYTHKGDFDNDGDIDVFDLMVFALSWSTGIGHPRFKECFDFNDDGKIDIFDLHEFAQVWGKKYPS